MFVPDRAAGAAQEMCNDELATNGSGSGACRYSCESLKQHFFPTSWAHPKTRCFIWDVESGGWPESVSDGPSPRDLLDLRTTKLEWRTYLEPTALTSPAEFTVGQGRACTNITIATLDLKLGTTMQNETVCLLDGEHIYNHSYTEAHTIEVAGYPAGAEQVSTTTVARAHRHAVPLHC
eukprot:SAG22_NODE_20_length_32168_cov_40.859241_3_plen_178_part_00